MARLAFYEERKQSKTVNKSFVFQKDLADRIKAEADKRGTSQNDLVSRILIDYFFGGASNER